jgi:hypothetical protein
MHVPPVLLQMQMGVRAIPATPQLMLLIAAAWTSRHQGLATLALAARDMPGTTAQQIALVSRPSLCHGC